MSFQYEKVSIENRNGIINEMALYIHTLVLELVIYITGILHICNFKVIWHLDWDFIRSKFII